MKKNEPLKNIMSKDPKSVQVGAKLSDVRQLLDDHAFHHVPVLDGTKVVGMVSHQDILRVAVGDPERMDKRELDVMLDYSLSLDEVMSADLVTVGPDQTVREAAEIFAEGRIHSLPVVEGDKLVGIVTSTDVVRYFLHQY